MERPKMAELESLETAAEHERILREIESTDTACIGPTLRCGSAGEPGGERASCSNIVVIYGMCSVLFPISPQNQVTDTNRKLQNEGKEVSDGSSPGIACRLQQRNISATVDKLTLCLPVLEMYSKLREQMKSKRKGKERKGKERKGKERKGKERKGKERKGKERKGKERKGKERKGKERKGKELMVLVLQSHKFSATWEKGRAGPAGGSALPGNEQGMQERQECPGESSAVPGAQDLVDFSPVYRCLHIYSVLGARETFESYYRKQRRKQARLVLQPPSNMHETLDGYRKYFNQIVGFFVVEDHILHTTQGLVNRAYIDELWEMALSKTIAALRTHSSYCSDPSLVLDLKNLIVLFADTLQGYGFPVNQLFDMLLEIQDQYSETLLKKWAGVFRNILDSDNYSPIPVSNEDVYRKIVGQFPFQDAELEKQPFPKKFPFSEFVPKVYGQIKEFIYACLKFSEDLHLSSTEVDDMIRKSTNLLLTRTLSNCLQNVIKRKNVGLTELVQIIINTTHLEKSCKFLEEFITNITNVLPETVHTTKLYGTTTFKDARHAAEEEIYTNLNQKIDQFLQLADYDWMAPEPGSRASEYLVDLIGFLRSTFAVFTHLPGKVAQTACMSACKHLSTSLLQLLLEAEVRQLTLGALHQFNLDVEECEQFARSGPVPGFQGDTLQLAFIDLRQLLDLFIQWDWSTYLADYGQPTCKYLRVNPTTALILLEKMRDTSRKNNVFAQFRKNERDKQKLIDTVAKQLRSLINSHHS
uniref:Exocyst complex component n=1 Tax=Junco hyemalis TaxID=40217 RepID=A0A8C5JP74_JUNHY